MLARARMSQYVLSTYLLLYELQLLRLQQLLWNALRIALRAPQQRPKLFAEWCGILVKETCQGNLELFDVGLFYCQLPVLSTRRCRAAYVIRAFDQVEGQVNDHVVFTFEDP